MVAGGRQQPDRTAMAAVAIGGNEIDRAFVIELIDLVPPVDHGHVPFEQIDEDALAVGMHRIENCVRAGRFRAPEYLDHMSPLPVRTREASPTMGLALIPLDRGLRSPFSRIGPQTARSVSSFSCDQDRSRRQEGKEGIRG
jgi:hypothetical protein